MSKANYINKRLVEDWISLQNWLGSRRLEGRDEWDNRSHEMDSHDIAEHSGYYRAIDDVVKKVLALMKEWPDLDAHRPYREAARNGTEQV